MTIPPIVDRSPDAMTNRARVYISAGGLRHLFIGLTLLLIPWLYASAAFIPLFNLLPLNVWGGLMLATGLVCVVAAMARNANMARWGIVASAVITLVLAAGITLGIVAVWLQWIQAVGVAQFQAVLIDHPKELPAYLRPVVPPSLTPLVPPSPFLPLVMLAVTVKDFTMCAQPLRVPLEERVGVPRPRVV